MKRIIILNLMVALFFFSIVLVSSVDVTHSSLPDIVFVYTEPVILHNISLYDVSGDEFEVLNSSEDNITWHFTPKDHLPNGNYTLYVLVSDFVSNYFEKYYEFEVLAPYMDIWMILPEMGASSVNPFYLEVASEELAVCRYSMIGYYPFDQLDNIGDGSDSFRHIIPSFAVDENDEGRELMMYIKCNESETSRIHPVKLPFTYDATYPTINAYAVPSTVKDRANRTTQIVASTSDKTICTLTEDGGQPVEFEPYDELVRDTYRKDHFITISYDLNDDNRDFNYRIDCVDLLQRNISTDVQVSVRYSTDFDITMVSPGRYTNKKNFDLEFSTDIITNCKYAEGESIPSTFQITNGKRHFEPDEEVGEMEVGEHEFKVTCEFVSFIKTEEFPVFVDVEAPSETNITVKNPTCSLSRIYADFSAFDKGGSGIKGYNYTLKKGSTVISSGFTSDDRASVATDLDENLTYKWYVRALDNAGNHGPQKISESITAISNSAVECDDFPPYAYVSTIESYDRVFVYINCTDGESGCRDDFLFCSVANISGKATCDYQTYYYSSQQANPIYFSTTERLFAKVFDKGDNPYNISKIIEFSPAGSNCMNQLLDEGVETDIDCGGTCPPCGGNMSCLIDSDCASNFCVAGLCQAVSCDDGVVNGDESDVDCGGYYCEKCDANKTCVSNYDCVSAFCDPVTNKCLEPLCDDGIKNGVETDVDCGGECDGCSLGKSCISDTDCQSGNCYNYECIEQDEPDDPLIIDEGEGLNVLALILLILGILLFLGGIGYIYYTKKNAPPDTGKGGVLFQNKVAINPNKVLEQRNKTEVRKRKIAQRIAKERALKKQKKRSSLLNTFAGADKEPKKRIVSDKGRKLKGTDGRIEKGDFVVDESKMDGGFVDLSAIKKKSKKKTAKDSDKTGSKKGAASEIEKQDLEDDVFQQLSLVSGASGSKGDKGNKSEKETAGKKQKKKQSENSKEEVFSELDKLAKGHDTKKLDDDDIFERLAKLSGTEENKIEKVFKSKKQKKQKQKDIMNIFANVTDKKQISEDVFKVILTQLLKQGALTKENVSDILFEYQDKGFISKGEVYDIMKSLGMLGK